jgi:DICT domain-containing protein
VLVACFEDACHFDEVIRRRYERLARDTLMIAVFGEDMPAEPAAGVRGTPLTPHDSLAHEWVVVVVAAHFSAALVARRLPLESFADAGSQGARGEEPSFLFAVTYDRDLAIAAAQSLVQRIAPPQLPVDRPDE